MKNLIIFGLTIIMIFFKTSSHAKYEKIFYDFKINSISGDIIDLSEFKGKPVLIVNTASYCGFTKQYEDMQKLWENYREKGLIVLGIPSNSFNQEKNNNNEVKDFCFTNNKGKIAVVESNRGFHIIEILGRRLGDYKKLAIINKKLEPSENTRKEFFANVAEKFQFEKSSPKLFLTTLKLCGKLYGGVLRIRRHARAWGIFGGYLGDIWRIFRRQLQEIWRTLGGN